MRGWLVGVYVLPGTPQPASPKEIHTEISISYKTDWPISSGYLLDLVAYINTLFLSMLATWLGTFSAGQVTSCFFGVWAGLQRELPASQNTPVLFAPHLLPVWFSHLYFLPGQSTFI